MAIQLKESIPHLGTATIRKANGIIKLDCCVSPKRLPRGDKKGEYHTSYLPINNHIPFFPFFDKKNHLP